MLSLFLHEIRSRRNAIIGWGIGLTLYCLMYTMIYPEMEGQLDALSDLSVYQAMGVEVGTFEGYLGTTVIGLIPVLLGVYAVMTSTTTLAGEEDDGTLEMLLTTRLPRWQIVIAKAVGIMIVLTLILILAGLGNMLGLGFVLGQIDTSVTQGQAFGVMMSIVPLVWALAMLSLFFGALLPNRRMAMLLGFLVLAWSYIGENLAGMVEATEFLKPTSLFTYFDSSSAVFRDGIAAGNLAVLCVVSALGLGLALLAFQRRDVTVGNWPWQRVRISG